jgi:UDP-2,3-diacylglucosamine hydrolase
MQAGLADGALGIIAGGGSLPARVAAAAEAKGQRVFVVALEGFAELDGLAGFAHKTIRLGAAGAIKAALTEAGCTDVVMIGPVKRPSLLDLRPDAEGAKLLARIGRAAFLGDDGLLAAIVKILGDEGFRVIGAHDILGQLLGPVGVLTETGPDAVALTDIGRGTEVLRYLGAADVGQACVVQQGIVLAVEAVEGTDAMLERVARLLRPGPAGVLVKLQKPGQDRRADMPTIGRQTVERVIAAGLRGIAFEGGGTIFLDREACTSLANAHGVFMIGVPSPKAVG